MADEELQEIRRARMAQLQQQQGGGQEQVGFTHFYSICFL